MQNQHPSPEGENRRRPQGMPQQVPPKRPAAPPPQPRDVLPQQKALTDEPEQKPPAKWKKIALRVLAVLAVLLALALVYVFLLLGEPDEDSQLTAQNTVPEESIHVPMAAIEAIGPDPSAIADDFGKPLLAVYSDTLTLQKAALFDTAFRGEYARRVTLTYAFADGSQLLAESIRPTAAVSLLGASGSTLRVESLYTMAGLDAVRVDAGSQTRLYASGPEAAYAITCPSAHVEELGTLVRQMTLVDNSAANAN